MTIPPYKIMAMQAPEPRYIVTVRADLGNGERDYQTAVRRGPFLRRRLIRRVERMLAT